MTTKILILGANGFIGNALTERLLSRGQYEVETVDIASDKLTKFDSNPMFNFMEADITKERSLIEACIAEADIVIPLVAIATPQVYAREPLRVFELNFEENLRIIRLCSEYKARIIFPSTSEVYGMNPDGEFNEDTTNLVMGPIHKQRWIYATAKQLLDRVIWGYGQEKGLKFTIIRPFNWIGPNLDTLPDDEHIGSSRVVTQFIGSVLNKKAIRLVDGGEQKRCFTYIDDGIDAIEAIIENPRTTNGEIINIGNPDNEASMRELAGHLLVLAREYDIDCLPLEEAITDISAYEFYGHGYQDIMRRKPDISKARKLLNWYPKVGLKAALRSTLEHFIHERV